MLYEHALVSKGFARWHRGRLIPIMRGGDQRSDGMFPELPADLATLTDEELSSLHDEIQDAGRTLLAAARERDADILGERTQDDVDTELTTAAESLSAIRAEQKARTDAEAEFDASLATHAEVFEAGADEAEGDEDDEPTAEADAPAEDADAEAAAEAEPVAQVASARRKTGRPIPVASQRHRAVAPDVDASGFRSQIRSEAVHLSYGDQLDRNKMGVLLNHVVRRNVVSPGGSVVVASATIPFDESRVLGEMSEERNVLKIRNVQQALQRPEALTASGVVCAPAEPVYDIFGVSTPARPVREAVPSMFAGRAAVITRAAPSMGVYDDAVGVITASENEDGSTNVKNCMRLICPAPTTTEVAAIYACIEADNLAARSDPELMAAVDELVRAEHARIADTYLLNLIKAGSIAVTGDAGGDGGAVFNLVGDILKMAAAYRSRHRMNPDAVLTSLFPAWVKDLLALDVARAAGYQRTLTRTEVNAWLMQQGIAPSYYLDSSTAATNGQIFGAQSNGAILDFPATMEWYLFAPGTWLHLDSGTLDLGVVRDSILTSTNDFQIFAEGWESIVKVGVESDCVTTAVCPSGTFSAGIDNKTIC
jgi:hypothetical protein